MNSVFHRASVFIDVRLLPLLAVAGLLSSCSSQAPRQEVVRTALPAAAFWQGDGVSGAAKIEINLSEQRLRYYKGGQLVGLSPISSGTPSHPTPRGSFKISEKDLHHRSSCYGDYVDEFGNVVVGDIDCRKDKKPSGARYLGASMKYFMRVNGPVGMHEGYLPGFPASHGCIRLPTQMAAIFYRVTPHGTPVVITGSASNASGERAIRIGENVLEDKVIEEVRNAPVQTAKYRSKPAAKAKDKKTKEPQVPRGQTQYLPGFS
jgi:hypothetical protein